MEDRKLSLLGPLEDRVLQSSSIIAKYPNRVPVIVFRHESCCSLEEIRKNKFLVPRSITLSQFMFIVRERISVDHEKAVYLFTDKNKIPPCSKLIDELYHEHKNADGFFYLLYTSESTFGC